MGLTNRRWLFIFSFLIFISVTHSVVFADDSGGSRHLEGSAGYGFGSLNVISPSNDIKINPAQILLFAGEKSFNFLHLYLEAMAQYVKTSGNLNYNYNGSANYQATSVNVSLDNFGAGFGLRFKIIENQPIRPFVGAGGIGNYMQLTYDSSLRTAAVTTTGNDYKTQDAVLDFSSYAEVGFELALTNEWGIQVFDRYIDSNTRPITTMKSQMLHYTENFYIFSIFTHF
jgi:hypothetical protein